MLYYFHFFENSEEYEYVFSCSSSKKIFNYISIFLYRQIKSFVC